MEDGKEKHFSIYSAFFNDSDTAMAVLSRELKIVAANRQFEGILESLPQKIRSRDDGYFPLFWSSLLPLASGQHNYAFFENSIRLQKNGKETLRWFNVHAWRIKNEAGGLIGLTLEDITLDRQEEKKLLSEKQIAEKTIEAKDRFLANMSHEIRTPIQTIIGMTELLQETNLNHEQSEYSSQVRFSALVLLSLINDILDYSKIEAGKMELENIDFGLEEIIEQAVEMITLEAHKKDLYIATSIPPDTNIIINGDPNKFRQVVLNLVKNAVKFTKSGGIIVSVRFTECTLSVESAEAENRGAEALCVSVADTGIGISEEIRPKLFSSFIQADASNSRRFGGTGLGLAISRNLVELMKGHIEAAPNEGGGSVFHFTVPLKRSLKKPVPLPPPEKGGKLKILVVDDCIQERKIIVSIFRDLGYTEIDEAETGAAALIMMRAAALNGGAYQLCFLDMMMPKMDGWRLAAEIHNDDNVKNADLVLMVPQGLMGANAKMTLLKWFKAYINKPIKRITLANTIAAVLNEIQELEELESEESSSERIHEEINRQQENTDHEGTAGEKNLQHENMYKDLRILIAEDHHINQKLFAIIMEKLGCRSILADDGLEAIEKTLDNKVDLIFMDIQMPGMTGYEATDVLRRQGFEKPIIAVTASALADEWERCRKAGMDDILFKPFLKADIEKMIDKWVFSKGKAHSLSGSAESIPVEGADTELYPNTVFNIEQMLNTFMHEKELALTLLSHFLERTEKQIKTIPEYIKAGNWENARIEAHTIKGAALTMGGKDLGQAAFRLEKAFKNIDNDEMEAAYPVLTETFTCFKNEAEKYIQSISKE